MWRKGRQRRFAICLCTVQCCFLAVIYVYFTTIYVGHEPSSPVLRSTTKYDICVVGAGLSGAVIAERYASTLAKSVLVVEKRDHIAGNCYDYVDEDTGIRVNKYGAHLFHTKYKRVWDYVQQFSKWTPYEHKVVANVDGKHVPVPVNIDTVRALFGLDIQTSEDMDTWLSAEQVKFDAPKNSEEMSLSRVGKRLYHKLFEPYTIKQWAKTPAELGPEVMARIPVRNNRDDRYFGDPYQALPTHGYTAMFKKMLDHSLITVETSTDYFDVRDSIDCERTYFTGPIDAYFAHLGWPKLEYRSLDFERKVIRNITFFQPNSVVNHPSKDVDFTRIVEYKHFLNQSSPHTVFFYERSKDGGDPYYPVPNPENKALYAKYQAMAESEKHVAFVGRLANYKYFNMDQSVLNALKLFDKDTSKTTGAYHVLTKPNALNDLAAANSGAGNSKENIWKAFTDLFVSISPGHQKEKCSPGKFKNVTQWRSLFPNNNIPLSGKALVSIPIGKKGRPHVAALVKSMGHVAFDYLFLAYDDSNWKSEEWYGERGVSVIHTPGGFKWTLYYDHLLPETVAPYSHLFLWDDDLRPTPRFDGEVLLHFLQTFDISIAQPMIRKNAHLPYEGTATVHRGGSGGPFHEVKLVEIQAPCYSKNTWLQCIRPRMVREWGTGWGIDITLHNYGDCVPSTIYAIRIPLDHMDGRMLDKSSGPGQIQQYGKMSEEKKWAPREGMKPPFRDYAVLMNSDCRLSLSI